MYSISSTRAAVHVERAACLSKPSISRISLEDYPTTLLWRGRVQPANARLREYPMSGLRAYNRLVRVKTSITLPKSLLSRLDSADKNRSAILERAAVAYLARLEREARDRRDIEIIERNADS